MARTAQKLKRSLKHLDIAVNYAEANMWRIERTNGGHLRFMKEGKQPIFSSSTPSCQFAARKIVAQLTRSDNGLPI